MEEKENNELTIIADDGTEELASELKWEMGASTALLIGINYKNAKCYKM